MAGLLAQLGEHLTCKQGIMDSSPASGLHFIPRPIGSGDIAISMASVCP